MELSIYSPPSLQKNEIKNLIFARTFQSKEGTIFAHVSLPTPLDLLLLGEVVFLIRNLISYVNYTYIPKPT